MPKKRTLSKPINIYLRTNVPEERVLIEIWEALTEEGRPQEEFRRFLLEGLRRAYITGDLPRPALDLIKPDVLRVPRSPGVPIGFVAQDFERRPKKARGRSISGPTPMIMPISTPQIQVEPVQSTENSRRRLRPMMG